MKKLKTILWLLMPAFFTILSVLFFVFLGNLQLINGWYVAVLIAVALSFLTVMYKIACGDYFVFASKMYSVIGVLAMVCLCFRNYHVLYTSSIVIIVLLCVFFWIKILNGSKEQIKVEDEKKS